METWIHDEILDGLSKLLCLSLERSPAADMIAGTAAAWVEAITFGSHWDEARDRPRFREAFITLANTREQWPAPKHFLEAIPRIRNSLEIAYERKPASPDAARIAAEKISKLLGDVVQPMPKARVERETTPEQRERIEADLREHYDRKRAAGGDA